jgi:proliferating cell nuclear antigen
MFCAKLKEGVHLKKLIESIKELVTDINLDISGGGISLQAMDSSHVALVTLNLSYEGFEEYRCDKGMTIGVNITHLSKIMKCGGNDDSIILRAEDEPSALNITFENRSNDYNLTFRTQKNQRLPPEPYYHRFRAPRYPRHTIQQCDNNELRRIYQDM